MKRSPMPSRATPIKRATTIRASGKRLDGCDCETCRPNAFGDMRMIVCAICGNKRCPHAADHRNACTGSNEPGQAGSSWAVVKPFIKRNSRPKMTSARKAARGKPCLVRLPGCDGGGETTVLAHYSLIGISGGGLKSPDAMGAWCCMSCHAIADGRAPLPEGYTRAEVRLALAEGVFRTQQQGTSK